MITHNFAVIGNNGGMETVNLTGTSQFPTTGIVDTEVSSFTGMWVFASTGAYNTAGAVPTVTGDWNSNSPEPRERYWIRVSTNSGRNPSGIALNNWVSLDSNQSFYWSYARNSNLQDSAKVEISSTSNGTIILATGYYGIRAEGRAGGGGGGGDPIDPIDEFLDPESLNINS